MHSFVINNTIFTGKFLIYEPQMLSTNLFAKNLISKTKPIDGSVIITDMQTRGKGQGQNQWLTEHHKNLTFSIIYDTSFLEAKDQFFLSAAIAVGIRNAIFDVTREDGIAIKWPNDIILKHKKLGGILIENSVFGNHLKHSIIGIGINVNQQQFEDLPLATSLFNQGFSDISPEGLLAIICSRIEHQFLQLKAGKFNSILKDYNQHLFQRNSVVAFLKDGLEIKGKIVEVTASGELVVKVNDQLEQFNFGEIKWLIQ